MKRLLSYQRCIFFALELNGHVNGELYVQTRITVLFKWAICAYTVVLETHNVKTSRLKSQYPLWLTLTRGPRFSGSLPVGTLVSVSPGKQRWTKGRDPREGLNSLFWVDCYKVVGCVVTATHSHILHSQWGVCCHKGLSHRQFYIANFTSYVYVQPVEQLLYYWTHS